MWIDQVCVWASTPFHSTALGLICCTLSIVHHGCWGHLWGVAQVSGGQIWVHQCSKLTPPASPVLLPYDVDRIGLCMGQHSVSLHGVWPDLLHTFHCTPCPPGSFLVCGPDEGRTNWGASMFKTDSTRIPTSVALRCGYNRSVYGPAVLFHSTALDLICCTLSIVHHDCWGHLWCVAQVSRGQIGVHQCSKLTPPASPLVLP